MMHASAISSRRSGFSLLELSVVLGIIAIVVGFGMTLGGGALKAADRVTTQERMAAIKTALDNYAKANGYLPCPSDRSLLPNDPNFGVEKRIAAYDIANPTALLCGQNAPGVRMVQDAVSYAPAHQAFIGGVPTRTLGLPDNYAGDAWGDKLTYAVSAPHTGDFRSYAEQDGVLTVMMGDRAAAPGIHYPITTQVNRTIVPPAFAPGYGATYVVISHGPDGRGAFPMNAGSVPTNNVCFPTAVTTSSPPCASNAGPTSCNDIENCDDGTVAIIPPSQISGPLVFYDTLYEDDPDMNPDHYFDDYVVWGSNALVRAVVSPDLYTSCPAGCESWCVPCDAAHTFPTGMASGSREVLCKKVMDISVPNCTDVGKASCYWSGPVGANYVRCP